MPWRLLASEEYDRTVPTSIPKSVYIHMHTYIYIYTCISTYVRVCTLYECIITEIHIYIYIHVRISL